MIRLVSAMPAPSTDLDYHDNLYPLHHVSRSNQRLPSLGEWSSNELITRKDDLKKQLRTWNPILTRSKSLVFSASSPNATQPQIDDPVLDASPPIAQPEPFGNKQSTNQKSSKRTRQEPGLPSSDQLETVQRELSETLPKLFVSTHKFTLYTDDLIFEDHIRKVATKGIRDYIVNISLLRIKGHLSYSGIALKILKITKHEDEGTVKVRWQIRGIPGWRVIFTFWRYVPEIFAKKGENINPSSDVWDGFSTFYVNNEGKIYRHLADKLMPDDEKIATTTEVNPLSKILSKTNLA
jgi:hypothetical protein